MDNAQQDTYKCKVCDKEILLISKKNHLQSNMHIRENHKKACRDYQRNLRKTKWRCALCEKTINLIGKVAHLQSSIHKKNEVVGSPKYLKNLELHKIRSEKQIKKLSATIEEQNLRIIQLKQCIPHKISF